MKTVAEGNYQGVFYEFCAPTEAAEHTFFICDGKDIEKFAACFRLRACWMQPQIGDDITKMRDETQMLAIKRGDELELMIPLVKDEIRCSLFANSNGLNLLCETQYATKKFKKALGLYCIKGKNIYDMIQTAFEEIRSKIDTFELKENKIIPKFINRIGFCTYNAFYDDYNEEELCELAENYRKNGVNLGYMIFDAGWHQMKGDRVETFEADRVKFPNGLKSTVERLKKDGLKDVIIWHAYTGKWRGFYNENFKEFGVKDMVYQVPKKFESRNKEIPDDKTGTAGRNFLPCGDNPNPIGFTFDNMASLYVAMYKFLKDAGVRGTKIDAMSHSEALSHEAGGRVAAMQKLQNAIYESNVKLLDGELINCSCNSNDYYFTSKYTALTRTSIDYKPGVESSHAIHILTNLHVGTFFAPLVTADWDMFQSGNTCGEFHAISKAVSGGPIYSTDEIGKERFDIIRRLCTKDGRVPICKENLRICQDCLFVDPYDDKKLIKGFNSNEFSYVIAVFNCAYDLHNDPSITEDVRMDSVDKLPKGTYVCYSLRNGLIGTVTEQSVYCETLPPAEADVLTLVPLKDGVAVIGDTSKYNPNGFVEEVRIDADGVYICAMEESQIMIYSERELAGVKKTQQNNVYLFEGKEKFLSFLK